MTLLCRNKLTDMLAMVQHPLLLIMRVYWGWQFFLAGKGKFANIENVAGFFDSIGIPFANQTAYLVAGTELITGLLLVVGLFARFAAIPVVVTMIVAYVTAHPDALLGMFTDPQQFISQDPFFFLLVGLMVMSFGAGAISVDTMMNRLFCRPKQSDVQL